MLAGMKMRAQTARLALMFALLFVVEQASAAFSGGYLEPVNSGWSLHVDNDLLSGARRDRDYTGGLALSLSGSRVIRHPWSLEPLRDWIDQRLPRKQHSVNRQQFSLHSLEFGFTLFTPEDIDLAEPQPDEHPFASLFFLASSQQRVFPQKKTSLQSTLTLGFLGLPWAEDVQSGIHDLTGGVKPQGWQHQISAGGELTAKYSLGLQKTLLLGSNSFGFGYEFKTTAEVNIGYVTDVASGFNWRWGRLNKPWWTFNPHQAEYISLGAPANVVVAGQVRSEAFVYAGGSISYRLYNAFLQGQFRDSAVSFNRSDLQDWVAEAWLGVSIELSNRVRVSTFFRAKTPEIDRFDASVPVWGGIAISQAR
jgi:hypothetical protein